jgi:hypothetical protein
VCACARVRRSSGIDVDRRTFFERGSRTAVSKLVGLSQWGSVGRGIAALVPPSSGRVIGPRGDVAALARAPVLIAPDAARGVGAECADVRLTAFC